MSELLIDDLRQQIANGQAIAIVGAGVSVGATNNAPAASWSGLLKLGIECCVGVHRADEPWAKRQRDALQEGSLHGTLEAAEAVSGRLGFANRDREWTTWLEDTVGKLSLEDDAALRALAGLGIRIATTNYDDLIEKVTGLTAVTWKQPDRVLAVLRGERKGIVHLHGFWDDPDSVVLGVRSYEQVLGASFAQALQQGMALFGTLLFIGCGEGLKDPNFSALREFLARHPARHRHFRLEKDDRCAEVRKEHERDGVSVIGYGPSHGHLATFLLERLTPKETKAPERADKRASPEVTPLPPKPARCIGRDREVEALVGAVLAGEPAPVLGSGGIGKSTICLQALHDRRVLKQFGARRYFVRCDGARTAEDLTAAIGAVLGIEPGAGLIGRITRNLGEAPAAIALDNLETPWEQEPLETEAVLAELAATDGLSLVVTLRTGNRPGGVGWRDAIEIQPLKGDDPRRLFLAVAGKKHENDAQLGNLLAALDGIPLAIELMAHAAEAEPNLHGVWQRWQEERTKMLKRGKGDHRLVNLAASVELSIASPKMIDSARRLLWLMGLLPDGLAHDDLDALLPGSGNAAAGTLRQLALAFDEGGRLRTLAPVREHVAAEHPPEPEDLQRAIAHYAQLAIELGPKCGAEGGREAAARLSAETANIESVLTRGLKETDPAQSIEAAVAFGTFQRFTGLGTPALLEAARDSANRIGDETLEANCAEWLGDITLARSHHDIAREHYERALPLHQRVGNVLGEAWCIYRLGDIALARSDHDGAREHFQRALPLYQRVGAVLGEANCIARLGDIALGRSDHDGALEHFQRALPLYQRVGAVLGEANCIARLGDIALARSDHDGAREHYEKALPLYQRVGAVLGEANCIKSLGDIALARSDHDGAREHYEKALALYQRVGDVLGEANCIKSLGDIALRAAIGTVHERSTKPPSRSTRGFQSPTRSAGRT